MTAFNGGKMNHIFAFDEKTHLYSDEFESEAARTALERGENLYYKIDGSNGVVRVNGTSLDAYQRLDTRGKDRPDGCIPLPAGKNEEVYPGHSYCYEPILLDVEGKKARKRNQAMLQVIEKHADFLRSFNLEFISVEWVGQKFNKTPGVPHDVAVAVHAQQVCVEPIERTYEGVRSFLLEADPPVEGLIVEHDNKFWKIRADCFDKKCRFKTEPQSSRPPIFLS